MATSDAGDGHSEEQRSDGRILVGVDGSDASASALAWAADLASRIGASIEAVTTWQWPTGLGPAIAFPIDYDPAGDARGMLTLIAAPVSERYPSVTITTRIVEGHPAEALVEGSRHASLLVVGSRGHGAFSGLLLGSVSQHCATHAECPVLIYRDPPRPW